MLGCCAFSDVNYADHVLECTWLRILFYWHYYSDNHDDWMSDKVTGSEGVVAPLI